MLQPTAWVVPQTFDGFCNTHSRRILINKREQNLIKSSLLKELMTEIVFLYSPSAHAIKSLLIGKVRILNHQCVASPGNQWQRGPVDRIHISGILQVIHPAADTWNAHTECVALEGRARDDYARRGLRVNNSKTMTFAGSDQGNVGQSNGHPKFIKAIVAPCRHRSVIFQCQGMIRATSNGDNIRQTGWNVGRGRAGNAPGYETSIPAQRHR